ncbi:tRNA-dihydrouridine synthase [Candidatus Dojkabacteria bacterium]|nr:tRNA-dihydrouridine synthase [Candidatus Dojkabacteria bacterium]
MSMEKNSKQNNNFWMELPRPFFALAPMDGVTDLPFRLITNKYGNPDLLVTEFVPVEALIRGIKKAFEDLRYEESEHPIIAQLYGHEPELFYFCAQITAELGFDGIDINMGCPARKIEQRGAGAGLIKTPDVAGKIVHAVKSGIDDWVENGISWDNFPKEAKKGRIQKKLLEAKAKNPVRTQIPVSVKTRIGYDSPDIKNWFTALAKMNLDAVSIHGRTLRQAYRGKADWDQIEAAAKLIKQISPQTIVIGNGDIQTREMGAKYAEKYSVDGVMIGRAAVGNPWVFSSAPKPEGKKLFDVMIEHAQFHYKLKDPKAFVQMRRILADYIKGIDGARELRAKLVRVNSPKEVEKLLLLVR